MDTDAKGESRLAPLQISADQFRSLGHKLVEDIAGFLEGVPSSPLTTGETPRQVRAALGDGALPDKGSDPQQVLADATKLLFDHSLLNGHPRFFGYVTASPAPIGILGDMLAAAVNPNVGGWVLSPMATEIEKQTVRWIAELIGYPPDCGGLLVSGGNMANFVGFIAARKAVPGWDVRAGGMAGASSKTMRVYTSTETHTWVQKAADLFGLGTDSISWIATDGDGRMSVAALRKAIREDKAAGMLPLAVVGTAGSVSTGAIDPLRELARICKEEGIWFHVDGAYGGFAACLPDAHPDLKALSLADSVAVDPHKWLYSPLEAGCALVRDPGALQAAFSYHPPYYLMADDPEDRRVNYHEYGPQNSRGFRALKVWLALKQVGREGYVKMIGDDIKLSKRMHRALEAHPNIEVCTQGLSISTFRYRPADLASNNEETEEYLNKLNEALLEKLHTCEDLFVSNAVVEGKSVLRACIVNFHTGPADVDAVPEIVARLGAEVDEIMRSAGISS